MIGRLCILDRIGKAIAQRLMADGAKVMISSRKEKNVSETLAELRGGEATTTSEIDGMVCHVGKAEHRQALMDKTLEKFGGIDILVSNAGTNPTFGPILNVSSLKNSELWCCHRRGSQKNSNNPYLSIFF